MKNISFLPYRIALYFHNGPYAGRTFESQGVYIPIGSAQEKNTLVIPDHSIQPEHAYIAQDRERIYIQAHSATSYVAVNNKQVQGMDLHSGDTITLGNASITCQLQIEAGVSSTGEEAQPGAYQQAQAVTSTDGYLAQQQSRTITNSVPSAQPILSERQQQFQVFASPGAYQAQQPGSMATNTQPSSANSRMYQSPDDVTRYLCAAVHSDEAFRDYVIEHIFNEEMKAPGEAYGVDIVPVVRWAFAARQRTQIRDIMLLVVSPIIAVVLVMASRSFPDMLQTVLPGWIAYSLGNFIALGLPTLVGFLLSFGLIMLILVLLIVRPFTPEKNRRWLLMSVISLFMISLIVYFPIVSVAWLIVIGERLWCYFGPEAKLLTRNKFRADIGGMPLDSRMEQWLRARFPQRDGNLVVYSGYSPFAGSGVNTHGWSLVVDVTKGKGNPQPQTASRRFEVKDLYAAQAKAIHDLGLKNLSIEDKLYANGKELRNQQERYQREILADHFASPVTGVSQAVVEDFKEHPTEDIRYYQCIKVTSWKGDLILSIFIRFYLTGKNSAAKDDSAKSLFVEGNYQLLTPIQERYREIDRLATSFNMRRGWLVIKRTFIPTTFKLILGPPLRLIRAMTRSGSQETKRQQTRNEIADNPSFDYGAITSLREVVSSAEYQRYFQWLDEEMYVKLIEYQVFETIIAFLDEHNIDTSQFKKRQEAIINNSLMVTGGTFNAGVMAFGEKSTINTTGNGSTGGQSTASK